MKKIHVFIVCWLAKEKNAEKILNDIGDSADFINVIYSTPNTDTLHRNDTWIQLPEECYYGAKVALMLEKNQGDILLQIHADCYYDNWKGIVERCRNIHDMYPDVGIWASGLDNTPFTNERVEISKNEEAGFSYVINPDGNVWSISSQVVTRLKMFNYSDNKYGHGIDWAAVSYAYANNLFVIRDSIYAVHHEKGTSYNGLEAAKQASAFLGQLSKQENIIYNLFSKYVSFKVCYPEEKLVLLEEALQKHAILNKKIDYIHSSYLKYFPLFLVKIVAEFISTLGKIFKSVYLKNLGTKLWDCAL